MVLGTLKIKFGAAGCEVIAPSIVQCPPPPRLAKFLWDWAVAVGQRIERQHTQLKDVGINPAMSLAFFFFVPVHVSLITMFSIISIKCF